MRCLFVAVGPNALFIVLPYWDNVSQAHILTHPVTFYYHLADQLSLFQKNHFRTIVLVFHNVYTLYVTY